MFFASVFIFLFDAVLSHFFMCRARHLSPLLSLSPSISHSPSLTSLLFYFSLSPSPSLPLSLSPLLALALILSLLLIHTRRHICTYVKSYTFCIFFITFIFASSSLPTPPGAPSLPLLSRPLSSPSPSSSPSSSFGFTSFVFLTFSFFWFIVRICFIRSFLPFTARSRIFAKTPPTHFRTFLWNLHFTNYGRIWFFYGNFHRSHFSLSGHFFSSLLPFSVSLSRAQSFRFWAICANVLRACVCVQCAVREICQMYLGWGA